MTHFSYKTPIVPDDFVPCDWNEGDAHVDLNGTVQSDRYVRTDRERDCIDYAREILSIPSQLRMRFTSGSDVALLVTLLFGSCGEYKHFRMREDDYAQVRAFAHLSYPNVELCSEADLFSDIKSNSIVYFSNPGNPSCKFYPMSAVEKVVRANPSTMFLMDNAYLEYHDHKGMECLSDLKNLIMFRTFSKYWGAAGIRLGVVVFPDHSDFIGLFDVLNSKQKLSKL